MVGSQQEVARNAEFSRRMATIRARFPSKLDDRIGRIRGTLHLMPRHLPDSATAVALAYRQIHDICGIASTVGFAATGLSARSLQTLLIHPFRAKRGLSDDELEQLNHGLAALRSAALADTST